MVTQLTVQNVLAKAIQREIESQHLYHDLSQKMTDAAARDTFRQLSQEEQQHENLLRKYLRGELREGALNREQVLDYKIAEHLEQPEISPGMKLKDVFLLAANREKASHEFYLSLAGVHPAGPVRRLLEQLASQELEHKQRVEFLFTETAFPQTDGG
ncbi:MAG: ferritin family protein, partial [Dehalococcoidia bacterium]|nr:ferritin family protein [Dehalococcoidia bacterium]